MIIREIPVNAGGKLLMVLAALFPLGMASVSHWSSTIFYTISAACLILWVKDRRVPLNTDRKVMIAFVLFFTTAILSLINADDWPENLRKIEKLSCFILVIPALLYLYREKIDLSGAFLLGAVAAGPVMGVVAYHETVIKGAERATGAYHPIVFGDLAMLVAVIGMASLLAGAVSKRWFVLSAISISAALYASALSSTRGAWLVLPALGILLFFLYRRLSLRKGLALIAFFSAVTVLSPFLFPTTIGEGVERVKDNLSRFQDGSDLNTPIGQRLLMWQIAVEVWREHPLIGTGVGDFRHETQKKMETGKTSLIYHYGHSHNIFLDALATTGIIGFLAMVTALFILPFNLFLRRWKEARGGTRSFAPLAGMMIIVSFGVFGLTEGWLARSPLVLSYLVSMLVFMVASSLLNSDTSTL